MSSTNLTIYDGGYSLGNGGIDSHGMMRTLAVSSPPLAGNVPSFNGSSNRLIRHGDGTICLIEKTPAEVIGEKVLASLIGKICSFSSSVLKLSLPLLTAAAQKLPLSVPLNEEPLEEEPATSLAMMASEDAGQFLDVNPIVDSEPIAPEPPLNPKLNSNQFKELAGYIISYINNNIGHLEFEQNESDFLRIQVPLSEELKAREGIEKLRVNYWSSSSTVKINPESIHTHPSYFESYIVEGGYKYELFRPEDLSISSDYQLFTILKNGTGKNLSYMGNMGLVQLGEHYAKKDDIMVIDTKMIHRVITTLPKTLTINAVFPENSKELQYNVYLSKNSTLDQVKTTRKMMSNSQSRHFLNEVVRGVKKFIYNHLQPPG